jgi:hypothetical protein
MTWPTQRSAIGNDVAEFGEGRPRQNVVCLKLCVFATIHASEVVSRENGLTPLLVLIVLHKASPLRLIATAAPVPMLLSTNAKFG